jgi:hypothetical protein
MTIDATVLPAVRRAVVAAVGAEAVSGAPDAVAGVAAALVPLEPVVVSRDQDAGAAVAARQVADQVVVVPLHRDAVAAVPVAAVGLEKIALPLDGQPAPTVPGAGEPDEGVRAAVQEETDAALVRAPEPETLQVDRDAGATVNPSTDSPMPSPQVRLDGNS